MRYCEPASVDEAAGILASDDGARCLAGGQTLVAMMNAGLASPSTVIGLRRIAELAGIRTDPDGSVAIGAMTSHAEVARSDRLRGQLELLREAASRIAHPAIRTLGTMGGAISHGDPSADYPGALVALDAEVVVAGPGGRRRIDASDFFVDFLTTALEPGELVVAVRFPGPAEGTSGIYEKFSRTDGDYATVSVAATLAMSGGRCTAVSCALGSCGATPVRSADAEARLIGSALDDAATEEASAILSAQADPLDDVRGSSEYRRMLIPGLVRRALERARVKLESAHG